MQLLTLGRLQVWIYLSIAGVDDSSACPPWDVCHDPCDQVTWPNVCEVTQDRLSYTKFLLVHDGPVLISASVIAPNISITAASLHMLGGGCLNTSSQALFVGPGLFIKVRAFPTTTDAPLTGLLSLAAAVQALGMVVRVELVSKGLVSQAHTGTCRCRLRWGNPVGRVISLTQQWPVGRSQTAVLAAVS